MPTRDHRCALAALGADAPSLGLDGVGFVADTYGDCGADDETLGDESLPTIPWLPGGDGGGVLPMARAVDLRTSSAAPRPLTESGEGVSVRKPLPTRGSVAEDLRGSAPEDSGSGDEPP